MTIAGRPTAPAAVLLAAAAAAWGTPASLTTRTPPDGAMGVLVMAHGGGDKWNAAVENAVARLRDAYPIEIAFGMAHRPALQDAVTRLEARGVERIAVVRLFISGASFLHQTEYVLGMRADPPETFMRHGAGATDGPHAPPPPVERRARVAVSRAASRWATAVLARYLEAPLPAILVRGVAEDGRPVLGFETRRFLVIEGGKCPARSLGSALAFAERYAAAQLRVASYKFDVQPFDGSFVVEW